MRIALLAVLSFAALWFVALRPQPSEVAPPAEPPVISAPEKAEQAVAQANAESAAREGAAAKADPGAGTQARPAPAKAVPAGEAKAAKPAAPAKTNATAASRRSQQVKTLLGDLEARKVVVLLFHDGRTSDDLEVRRAVQAVDRRGGRVAVHVASIKHLGDYAPITKGVPVQNSPTVLVIDRNRQAKRIAGLTVTSEIDDAVTALSRTPR
jgi:hypothetical protein